MTLSVQLTEAGPIAADFPTLLSELQTKYRDIFGADAYLEADSMDGELLAVFATEIHNCNAATINAINSFSPTYAAGTGLSSVVKINGIERLVPTHSTALVTLTGQVGKSIINGQVQDIYGNYWTLPSPLTFPSAPVAGQLIVTATALEAGAITAQPGEINKIATPTLGWQTVTNTLAAVPGQPVETDAELRARQTLSVAVPSVTIKQSIEGSLANLTGVNKLIVHENDTNITNGLGVPAHSIWVITYGGNSSDIANIIALKKSPGTGTYGGVTVPVTVGGSSINIKYSAAVEALVDVKVNITPKVGYTSLLDDRIKTNILNYIDSLKIGDPLEFTKVVAAATGPEYNVVEVFTKPSWDITWGSADINVVTEDLIVGSTANIEINIV